MNSVHSSLLLALAEGIRSVINTNPPSLRGAVEEYLETETGHLSVSERLAVLDNLMLLFSTKTDENGIGGLSTPEDDKPTLGDESQAERCEPEREGQTRPSEGALLDPNFARLVSLMLGKKMAVNDLSPSELSEKLAAALNTVFDTLNQIVEMIQVNLLGKRTGLETIRQIIGSQIGSGTEDNSLQNYLDQIREAFLIAHKASKMASLAVFEELVAELDPEKIAASGEGRLKFGPLRKAEFFDMYRQKWAICQGWIQSGRVTQEFLKEFEKACQKVYKKTA